MNPNVDYFDLSTVWMYIMAFFGDIFNWLFTHGFHIFDYYISFGEVLVTATVLSTLFWVCLPWFTDSEHEWVDYDYYDHDEYD